MSHPSGTSQKAVVVKSTGVAELTPSFPIPQDIKPGYVLVRTVAVALNPTDWKHIDTFAIEGALVGCDYSGYVTKIGPGVTKNWKVGDRIAGFCQTVNALDPQDGAFAEYVLVKADVQIRIPDSLSFEGAATLGVGIVTVGQAMYQTLKLPLPPSPYQEKGAQQPQILIYGGSTATGTLAIQLARLSGFKVITTSSPSSFDLCRSLGSSACFDYNDPQCGSNIRTATSNDLHYIFDTITEEPSLSICAAALSTNPPPFSSPGGVDDDAAAAENHYTGLLPLAKSFSGPHVKHPGFTIAYTFKGEEMKLSDTIIPAKKGDFEFMKGFIEVVEGLLEKGEVKTHPVEVGKAGLVGVLEGLQRMRERKVRGKKLVYRVGETG